MKDITVQFTAEQNLCISCGVCKGICPRECISMKKNNGLFVPDVDEDKCVNCGLCTKVCPGLQFDFQGANTLDAIKGPVIDSFNAWSKEPLIRHMSASGGVISSLIRELLKLGEYDVVFNLDTYNYDTQLKLKAKDKEYYNAVETKKDKTLKSRYLPVSHEDVVKYIKSNPDGKAIIIGTSCALQGITKAIRILKKNRENYLLIGLFCDKVFNYDVIDYFKSRKFSKGKVLSELHFKNKDSGGWPGDMKFIFSDESTCFYKGNIRLGLKEFFTPERCVYCIDKLNVVADI
jgi:coenzyme F420 hydrogenase subunit beta